MKEHKIDCWIFNLIQKELLKNKYFGRKACFGKYCVSVLIGFLGSEIVFNNALLSCVPCVQCVQCADMQVVGV